MDKFPKLMVILIVALLTTSVRAQPANSKGKSSTEKNSSREKGSNSGSSRHFPKQYTKNASTDAVRKRAMNRENYEKYAVNIKWNQIGEKIVSDDALQRRAASFKLASDTPRKQNPKSVIHFIALALNSDDAYVRECGTITAYRIAFFYRLRARRQKGKTSPYDITKNPKILPGLKQVLAGSHVQIRNAAINTLALAYNPIFSMRKDLLNEYTTSTSAREKGLLISLFAAWGYDDNSSVALIINALHSESAYVKNRAVIALGKLRPDKAVDDLVHIYFGASESIKKNILHTLDQYSKSDVSKSRHFQDIATDIQMLGKHLNDDN